MTASGHERSLAFGRKPVIHRFAARLRITLEADMAYDTRSIM